MACPGPAQTREALALFPSPTMPSFLNSISPLCLFNTLDPLVMFIGRYLFIFSFMKQNQEHDIKSSAWYTHSPLTQPFIKQALVTVLGHVMDSSPRYCPHLASLKNKKAKTLGFCPWLLGRLPGTL